MASPRRPATLPELFFTEPLQVRATSPSHTSGSSSLDASSPESQDATLLGFPPSVVAAMNHYDEHAKSAPELSASSAKEAGPNIGTPDIAIIGSPIDLPNPYEASPGLRKSFSTADLYESQARTSVDSDSIAVQRLPSILRPAHPRFADSTDSRRASMAIPGVGYGHPLPTEEEFQRILDSHGTAPVAESMASVDHEDRRSFPTYDNSPYGIVGRLSFASETRLPIPSEGLTAGPMPDGDRIRRHSAAATSHKVQPALRQAHSSSPLSHPTEEPEREEPSQVRKDQQFTDLWPEVPTGTVKKRASRWKFWTK